jgi:hypothetical protein
MDTSSDQDCNTPACKIGIAAFVLGIFCLYFCAFGYVRFRLKNVNNPESTERAIIAGQNLPFPQVKLCKLCKALHHNSKKDRIQHYDDFQGLQESAQQGCWCCWTVCKQLVLSMEDHDCPPIEADPKHLKIPCLLIWFANQTHTKTGYLDHLRQIGMCLVQILPGLMPFFTNFAQDYLEYIFKPRPRACASHPSSETSFRLIKDWLKTCDLKHQCYQGNGVKLPTRLIDVSEKQPVLLESNNLQGPYIALSHCWGNIQPITTTVRTIKNRFKGIPIETLPKMFQDAVHITRRLNIKYLWIDMHYPRLKRGLGSGSRSNG